MSTLLLSLLGTENALLLLEFSPQAQWELYDYSIEKLLEEYV